MTLTTGCGGMVRGENVTRRRLAFGGVVAEHALTSSGLMCSLGAGRARGISESARPNVRRSCQSRSRRCWRRSPRRASVVSGDTPSGDRQTWRSRR